MYDREKDANALIAVLRETKYDPNARREYDMMAGAYMWTDEAPGPFPTIPPHFRLLTAYRASLILGEPRTEFEWLWRKVLRGCPEWPGFRPERRNPALRPGLEGSLAGTAKLVDQINECLEVQEREDERKEEDERKKKMLH